MLGEITTKAKDLITGDRQVEYGEPLANFRRFADLLNAQFRAEFSASDAALVVALLKISRLEYAPKLDTYVDAAGYIDIAGELAGVTTAAKKQPHR